MNLHRASTPSKENEYRNLVGESSRHFCSREDITVSQAGRPELAGFGMGPTRRYNGNLVGCEGGVWGIVKFQMNNRHLFQSVCKLAGETSGPSLPACFLAGRERNRTEIFGVTLCREKMRRCAPGLERRFISERRRLTGSLRDSTTRWRRVRGQICPCPTTRVATLSWWGALRFQHAGPRWRQFAH